MKCKNVYLIKRVHFPGGGKSSGRISEIGWERSMSGRRIRTSPAIPVAG